MKYKPYISTIKQQISSIKKKNRIKSKDSLISKSNSKHVLNFMEK